MARTDVYERILDELAGGQLDVLEEKVFRALRRVYPASLTRYDLLEVGFGYRPAEDENLNNNTDDRKIRTAIASMFEKGVPIVSTSGEAGYRIDINQESWESMVHELEARESKIRQKVDTARAIMLRLREAGRNVIPTDVPATPKQLSFMGDRQ